MTEGEELIRTGETSTLSLEGQLTRQFYAWEKRGRGWKLWDYPIQLEPPFRPFFRYLPAAPVFDDARKPTFFSALADKIFGKETEAAVDSDTSTSEEDFREQVPEPVDDG